MIEQAYNLPVKQRRVGQYALYQKLGEGSMGKVYQAMRAGLPRRFALKLVEIDGPKAAESLTRVRREVLALAQFHHPHIVGLIDAFSVNEKCVAIVMDYVNAESLSEQLPLMTPAQVMLVLRQLASALTVVHEAGIVHRDVKPSNLLVSWPDSKKPHAFLIDFGITRYSADPDVKESLVGSPAYASPEQFKSNQATALSDVFSLGAIGYEAVTGAPPFTGKTVVEALQKHATWTKPSLLGDVDSFYPREFCELVAQCLDPDPLGRPEAKEVMERIDDIMGLSSVLAGDSSALFDEPNTDAYIALTAEVETSELGDRIWIEDGRARFQRADGTGTRLLETRGQAVQAVAINERYAAAATTDGRLFIQGQGSDQSFSLMRVVESITLEGPLLIVRCEGNVTMAVELDTRTVSIVDAPY